MFWKILSLISGFITYFFIAMILQWLGGYGYKLFGHPNHLPVFWKMSHVIPSIIFGLYLAFKFRKTIIGKDDK